MNPHSGTSSSEDIDLEDEEEEEEEEEEDEDDVLDGLDAPDFPSKFLQTANWKHINIYDENQLTQQQQLCQERTQQQQQLQLQLGQQQQQQQQQQQLKQQLAQQQQQELQLRQHQEQQQYQQQPQYQQQQQHHQEKLHQQQHQQQQQEHHHQEQQPQQPNTNSQQSKNLVTPQSTRIPPSNDQPIQKSPLDSVIPDQHQTNLNPPSSTTPRPNNQKSNEISPATSLPHPQPRSNRYTTYLQPNPLTDQQQQHQQQQQQQHQHQHHQHQPSATLTSSGVEATWATAARSSSRASLQPTPTARSNKPHQPSAPATNRSRMGSSDDTNTPTFQRPRRLSDGSINGGVRKDMLLQRMAEALQSERAKALVFQRELQNAEREIDELANTLDEQRRVHHKAIVSLKKDIKLLKKERENLVEALEAAEGVEQEEAERYLALLDPAAQAVMVEEEDNEDPRHQLDLKRPHKNNHHSIPPPQPIFDDYDISDYKSTIRAQIQERSALRAQRINSELLKINPGSSGEPNGVDSEREQSEQQNGEGPHRQGRTREPTTRIRRKLSKSRPNSRDGTGGGVSVGLFWKRSGSRNRETNDEKPSAGPGTVYRSTERRKLSGGTHPTIAHEDDGGYYDSGPLQRSNESFGHRSPSNGKIGKLFRKVFPAYKDDPRTPGTDDEPGYSDTAGFDRSAGAAKKSSELDRAIHMNRRRRSVLE